MFICLNKAPKTYVRKHLSFSDLQSVAYLASLGQRVPFNSLYLVRESSSQLEDSIGVDKDSSGSIKRNYIEYFGNKLQSIPMQFMVDSIRSNGYKLGFLDIAEYIYNNKFYKVKQIKLPYKYYKYHSYNIYRNSYLINKFYKFRSYVDRVVDNIKYLSTSIPFISLEMLSGNVIKSLSETCLTRLNIFSKNLISEFLSLFGSYALADFHLVNVPDLFSRSSNLFKSLDQGLFNTVFLGYSILSEKRVELRSSSVFMNCSALLLEPNLIKFNRKFIDLGSMASSACSPLLSIFSKVSLYSFIDVQMKLKSLASSSINSIIKSSLNRVKYRRNHRAYLRLMSSYSKIDQKFGLIARIYTQNSNYALPYWNAHIFIQMLRTIFMKNRFVLLRLLSRALFKFRYLPKQGEYAPKALKIEASGLIKRLGRANKIQYKLANTNNKKIEKAVDYENITAISRYGITNIKVNIEY